MSKKRKNGFELDWGDLIVRHGVAQVIGHGGVILMLGTEQSPAPEYLKKSYKEYQEIIHFVLFLVLFAIVNKFV